MFKFAVSLGSPSSLGLPSIPIDSGIRAIASTAIVVAGMISVAMIVVGGLQYAISAGDPGSTKRAKDTILYAVIGLIVSALAFGIVTFVTSKIV